MSNQKKKKIFFFFVVVVYVFFFFRCIQRQLNEPTKQKKKKWEKRKGKTLYVRQKGHFSLLNLVELADSFPLAIERLLPQGHLVVAA